MMKPPDSNSDSDDSDTHPHPNSNTNSKLKHSNDLKCKPKINSRISSLKC